MAFDDAHGPAVGGQPPGGGESCDAAADDEGVNDLHQHPILRELLQIEKVRPLQRAVTWRRR
jgi:hypothetical protein